MPWVYGWHDVTDYTVSLHQRSPKARVSVLLMTTQSNCADGSGPRKPHCRFKSVSEWVWVCERVGHLSAHSQIHTKKSCAHFEAHRAKNRLEESLPRWVFYTSWKDWLLHPAVHKTLTHTCSHTDIHTHAFVYKWHLFLFGQCKGRQIQGPRNNNKHKPQWPGLKSFSTS